LIFEDLDFLEEIKLQEIEKFYAKSSRNRYNKNLFRSNMMLNPLKLNHINRLDNLKCDMVTINLEDAIAPAKKKEALYKTALFISHLQNNDTMVIVRVNPIYEGGLEEILYLNQFSFDAIRVSKISTVDEMKVSLKVLSKDKDLHISLETKEAFSSIGELKFDDRFTTINLGILDLLSSLKLPQSLITLDNPTIDYILSKFLIDSKTVDILPISFMFQDYKDTQLFQKWCKKERDMGFSSKACMGPAQVDIANKIFNVDSKEIQKAQYIKQVFEKNAKQNINGFLDSKYGFIDEPIYKDALLVLEGL
jgi:citrate lyase subunit beta/citryl-CoA lyase